MEDTREVRQTREREATRVTTIRSLKRKDHSENYQKVIGMPWQVCEQGGCIIKVYYGKINLALCVNGLKGRD